MEGGLEVSPHPVLVRHQMGLQPEADIIHIQKHGGVVHQRGLMDVDVQPVIGPQHQRSLHGQPALGPGLVGLLVQSALYLILQTGYPGSGVCKLVGVVISGNAVGQMVAGEVELGLLPAQGQIVQMLLLGNLIAEAQSVVEEAEAHGHHTAGLLLLQSQGHFMKMVPHLGIFTPHRTPAPVYGIPAHGHYREAAGQVRLVAHQSQAAGGNDGQSLVGQFISHRPSGAPDIEGQFPGGRAHLLRSRLRRQDGRQEEKGSGCYQILFHTVCFIIFQDNSVASESVTRPLRTGTVISLPAPAALCE